MEPRDRIIVALDVPTLKQAGEIMDEVGPHVGMFKVGLELLHAVGTRAVVEFVQARGGKVFVDAKLHDIPATVAGASRALASMGVTMFNVHASGGRAMMTAARMEARASQNQPLVIAVTLLTSMDHNDFVDLGLSMPNVIGTGKSDDDWGRSEVERIAVHHFARVAWECRLDGVIASPREISAIRRVVSTDFRIITPGVRPSWAAVGDQKRVATPGDAMRAGADMIVVGRPITNPPEAIGSRAEAARRVLEEVTTALAATGRKDA